MITNLSAAGYGATTLRPGFYWARNPYHPTSWSTINPIVGYLPQPSPWEPVEVTLCGTVWSLGLDQYWSGWIQIGPPVALPEDL